MGIDANTYTGRPMDRTVKNETISDNLRLRDNIQSAVAKDPLQAKIEAALRPLYEQSIEQLRQQRLANNAAIDVDAASRGMGNSTWVTDAKLRQLKDESAQIAALEAEYNNQLYNAIQNAKKGGGSGSGNTGAPVITPLSAPDITTDETPIVTGDLQDILNKGGANRAIVNPWNFNLVPTKVKQYTK